MNENLTSQINLLEKYIIENMKKEDIPGISYAIIFNDEVVFANSYGYSDKENKNYFRYYISDIFYYKTFYCNNVYANK